MNPRFRGKGEYVRRLRFGLVLLLLLAAVLAASGCSVRHSVRTPAAEALSKRLAEVEAVRKVDFSFARPELTIYVKTETDSPGEETIDAVLARAKDFATVEAMDEIAKSVKWNDRISEVILVLYDESRDEPYRKYGASYYKTFDASDTSADNIDGYSTWSEYKLQPRPD
ncbi:hypothetical protein H7B90_25010 [Cohnella xylanilytica]|uniref:Uncharacterized protein n=1 Tax=Cohnella xylanilytica TaxID=557555 RepID=A0A841U509_9BACL|nr:hypothetical protein [Cohnella xylanilytica]MBB6694662.1 hypothetical protein [Cohnella xylanilytica]